MSANFSLPLNTAIQHVINNCFIQVYHPTMDIGFPLLSGNPGIGKTTGLEYFARSNFDADVVRTYWALKPIEELTGIPYFDDIIINGEKLERKGTKWSETDLMQILCECAAKKKIENKMVLWVLDDIHFCDDIHMQYFHELLTEKKLKDSKIPDNVAIVLCGNHGDKKAGANHFLSTVISRCRLIPAHSTFDDWKKNFAIRNNIHISVLSFLNQDINKKYLTEEEQMDDPFGCSRTWARLSNEITLYETWNNNTPIDVEMIRYLSRGYISEEAANLFSIYYSVFSQFNCEDILNNYQTFELPYDPTTRYTMLFALLGFYNMNYQDKKFITAFSHIIYKYVKEDKPLALVAIHDIIETEKILNKKGLYISLAVELNKIEQNITKEFISDIKAVGNI